MIIRTIASLCLSVLIAMACGKKDDKQQPVNPPPVDPPVADTLTGLVIATNNSTKSIEVYDAGVKDWNKPEAKKWSWKPATASGFSAAESNAFDGGSDIRLRQVKAWHDSTFVALTDTKMAAIITWPDAVRRWSQPIDGNLHAAEILPNGNVALAASDGNWVRVYASSQGHNNNYFVQYDLNASHAALWDPTYNLLWVTGQHPVTGAHILTALEIGGTAAAPTLTEVTAYRSVLPTAWGHDVAPYFGDVNRLWVSTNGGVYVYNKTTKSFVVAPGGSNRTFVKAVGNIGSAGGLLVQTRADANKSPTPAVSCGLNGWATSTVDVFTPSGTVFTTRVAPGACFYKARIINTQYQ
jgi:hypothetical protein